MRQGAKAKEFRLGGKAEQDHDKEVESFVVQPVEELKYDGIVRLGAASPSPVGCITSTPRK
jgi:hypothetical protein